MVTEIENLLKGTSGSFRRKAEAVVRYFEPAEITEAFPNNTHAAIETVEAYGLSIGVDANGYASKISFPYGADYR